MACCTDCQAPLERSLWSLWEKNNYGCEASPCEHRLCVTCYGKRPLLENLEGAAVKHHCLACFQQTSTLDFSKTYDTVQGKSDVVFVFVHAASGCRQGFRPQANELKERFGHSSILIDLPGHGTRVEEPLSLESSRNTIEETLKECESWTKGKKLVYVGGSLGAYVGFYVVEKLQTKFYGAVLMDCGQNVGPDASLKAKVGLVVLKALGRHLSNATMMTLMMGELKKSKADYHLVEAVFGAGMFFEQAEAHVECLKGVAPAEIIPNIQIPILFMNGSEDYRDSEDKWLSLCAKKEASELKVYEGGDHFFMYDTRFVDDLFTRIDAFAKKL
jgi:pimeloyl-ACP methyl ester carboxylesterase